MFSFWNSSTSWHYKTDSDSICKKGYHGDEVCLSPLTETWKCLKWSVHWTHWSSHRFSRLVQMRHEIAIWWAWRSALLLFLRLTPLPRLWATCPPVSKASLNRWSSGATSKGNLTLHQTEYSLYANTQLTKTKQLSVVGLWEAFAIKMAVACIQSI